MIDSNRDYIQVGRHAIDMDIATDWVRAYTDGASNRTSAEPYAFPAYDHFDADRNEPSVLTDADLLAPALLNVNVGIREFYGLQQVRGRLQRLLAQDGLATPLAELDDERIGSLVGSLFSVLDNGTKLWGVGGITLSKVLHRKRPASIPLHDKWVRACYVHEHGPVPRAKERLWAEYMTLIAQAMAKNLRDHAAQFARLQSVSKAEPPLTDLRILDILAWNRGQQVSSDGDLPPEATEPASS